MTGQQAYDAIAKRYRESKWLLFRHFIERYTLFEVLGDLRGRTVLDLACGEGVYTRQFKRPGGRGGAFQGRTARHGAVQPTPGCQSGRSEVVAWLVSPAGMVETPRLQAKRRAW